MEEKIKKLIFKLFPFETYLWIISKIYFVCYNIGLLQSNPNYKNHYFIKNFIKTGDVIIDIGANLGYYTIPFSKWVGQSGMIHALEPVKEVFNVLSKNVRGRSNVKIYPYALGEENKKIKLGNNTLVKEGIGSGSHFVLNSGESADTEFECEMKRGSEIFMDIPKLDLIKCDIEEYEIVVLPEMVDLINKHKPIILVEARRNNRIFIVKYFKDLNFEAYVLEGNKLYPETLIPEKMEDDLYLIHKSQLSNYENFIKRVC